MPLVPTLAVSQLKTLSSMVAFELSALEDKILLHNHCKGNLKLGAGRGN
jgi:hypothetical protein